jgi:hypothetical protein
MLLKYEPAELHLISASSLVSYDCVDAQKKEPSTNDTLRHSSFRLDLSFLQFCGGYVTCSIFFILEEHRKSDVIHYTISYRL